MWPLRVVERKVFGEPGFRLRHAVVGVEIDLLVLHAVPQPLDEDVVTPAALAVHVDADIVLQEQGNEVGAGELAALVGVEDLGYAVAVDCLPDGIDAEIGRQRIRNAPA